MPQLIQHHWQKVALGTLLWLLNPIPSEAEKAYLGLFRRVVRFLRYRGAVDPEELAEETLARVAETVYLRLTGLKRENVQDAVHEVPRDVSREIYDKERDALPALAFSFARRAQQDRYLRARRSLTDALELPASPDESALMEERRLLEQTLALLSRDDRRLLEKYYDVTDKDSAGSRSERCAPKQGSAHQEALTRRDDHRRGAFSSPVHGILPARRRYWELDYGPGLHARGQCSGSGPGRLETPSGRDRRRNRQENGNPKGRDRPRRADCRRAAIRNP
jgi:hypothetical protein